MRSSRKTIVELYKQDNDYSLQFIRWFLKPIGAWPALSTISERILSKFLRLICQSLVAVIVIPSLLYIIVEEKDFRMKLKAIGPASHWLMGALNYCSLLYQQKHIRGSVEHMESDWRLTRSEHDRKVMLKNARVGRVISVVCALIMQIGVLCFVIVRGLQPTPVVMGNTTIMLRRLPCPIFNLLIDTRFSPVYEIMLTLQYISAMIVNNTTVGACALAAVFAAHGCGQLDVVISRLEELVDKQTEVHQVQKGLANLVEHHLRTLKFLSRMEIIMREICFVELFGCTFNMCMIGYYCITEWSDENISVTPYFIVYTSMIFNIFIFCYIGELVTEQCKKVGEAAYLINWYQMPHNTAYALILIILRSNIVVKITAGKTFHMSIATFGAVIKTSLAYLNMLRTVAM